ncbi:adenylosuccinate lyase [Brenneria corticis]|uniref:Adenylosuccinate lyase n=1 Tax=Brenneria corticis TaxID=2173106 RepID=A0A2U1U550_9GAMM|nr:adenylosuccinate lyase [Brenneria sp. CFCC 11842]PWC16793.1 adenylosuccinate lyase [Brenneria sp. CFCC 11842]
MGAYVIDSELFGDQFGTAEMRDIFSDRATVQRWLDVEAALADVQAELGIIPTAAAVEIRRQARAELIDLAALKADMDRMAHPIVPLLKAMKQLCAGGSGEYIHWGATTQDIMDTGTVLQIRDALTWVEKSLAELIAHTLALAVKYRDLTMVGRSHGQQALPITFGFKAAGWTQELRRGQQRLQEIKPRVLVGQFGGAVGTLASLGDKGIAVQQGLFRALGLNDAGISWHVSRDSIAELAAQLAMVSQSAARIAHEIYNLQKSEIAELEEPFNEGKVGSSTMPHKRNPPACETVVALARIVRSTVPLALEAMVADHERDKIALQTEREFVSRVFSLTHAALKKTAAITARLSVRESNMERNLHLQKGLLLSEAVMMRLGEKIGRQEAHDILYHICMAVFERGGSLQDALQQDARVTQRLETEELAELLAPHRYTGLAGYFVDRIAGIEPGR